MHDTIRRMKDERFARSRTLLGEAAFERLAASRVAVFGLGGVGGWCAEALVRTGVRHVALIDDDAVVESNTNRQRQATAASMGGPKADVLRRMLLEIVPGTGIEAICERYTPDSAARFGELISGCDFIIDAIDSVDCKAHLIRTCTGDGSRATIFSSMGAALRTDPTRIRTAPFCKVAGDGLARALRQRFRRAGVPLPRHTCVYSDEPPARTPDAEKGSIMPVTCAFGMALASLVVRAAADQAHGLRTDARSP